MIAFVFHRQWRQILPPDLARKSIETMVYFMGRDGTNGSTWEIVDGKSGEKVEPVLHDVYMSRLEKLARI